MGALGAVAATAPVEALAGSAGWRAVFLVLAACCAAVAALIFFVVPDRPLPGAGETWSRQFTEIGAILRNAYFWRVALPLIVVHGAYQALQGLWLAPWLADVGGQSRPEVARTLMAGSIAYGLGSVIFGTLADRMAARLAAVKTGMALSVGAFFVAAAGVGEGALAIVVLYGFGACAAALPYAILEDIHPFYEDRGWLNAFGEVLVVYWDPIYHDPDTGMEKTANVTQYTSGLKIDFTMYPVSWLRQIAQASALPAELDAGYTILFDKDRLAEGMKQPTFSAYIPTVPTYETYQKWIHDFFSDAPYAAICLRRGELLRLKWCLDYDMKHIYLRQMLEWKIGLDHTWSVSVGSLGKGLKERLPPDLWSQFEKCYAGANMAENWQALFHTMALFRQVAMEEGNRLGYDYSLDLDEVSL